jgi:hypothetical protein
MMRRLLWGVLLVLSAVTAALFAFPGQAACTVAPLLGVKAQSVDVMVDPQLNTAQLVQLIDAARARIHQTFGPSSAKPTFVFYTDSQWSKFFKLSPTASTHLLGSYACITVGANGQNIDVIAHELMHAELNQRVGAWQRFRQIPPWFDEGLAMQVDHRAQYDTQSSLNDAGILAVKQLQSGKDFYVADEPTLTAHYAAAKHAVRQWLFTVGNQNLYAHLDKIKHGQSFHSLVH